MTIVSTICYDEDVWEKMKKQKNKSKLINLLLRRHFEIEETMKKTLEGS